MYVCVYSVGNYKQLHLLQSVNPIYLLFGFLVDCKSANHVPFPRITVAHIEHCTKLT